MSSIYDEFFVFSNELYNLNLVKGKVSHHFIDGDKKLDQLLSFFFEIDISKFEQHKSLAQLKGIIQCGVSFANINRNNEQLTIAYYPSGIMICYGCVFNIHIKANAKSLNNVIFEFYSVDIAISDILNGSVYDIVYCEILSHLNRDLPSKKTFKDILKITDSDINCIIKNTIIDNTVFLLDVDQFMNLYIESESLSKNHITGAYIIKDIKSIHYKVSEYFKYFISDTHLNKLNSVFSLIIFYEKLIDPSFEMVDINVQKVNHSNKFQEIYELYLINFYHNATVQTFKVITGEQVLSYEIINRHDDSYIRIEGIDNIYNHFKNLITDLISKTLDIQPTEIDNESILLYNMATL